MRNPLMELINKTCSLSVKEKKGVCGKFTVEKQIVFTHFLKTHILICSNIFNRYHWVDKRYYYFDLNAGPGIYNNGSIEGSPVISIGLTRKYLPNRKLVFIDNDYDHYQRLLSNIPNNDTSIAVHYGDQHQVMNNNYFMPGNSTNKFGIVYLDPPGTKPDFELFSELSKIPFYKRIDFLCYLSATNIKRTQSVIKLNDSIRNIDKKYWLIRKPMDTFQWTFIFGYNWGTGKNGSFPKMRKQGFLRLETEEGQEMLRKLSCTKRDIERWK